LCFAGFDVRAAADRPGVVAQDRQRHPISEIPQLLRLEAKLLEGISIRD
jgi:hypothetical protein